MSLKYAPASVPQVFLGAPQGGYAKKPSSKVVPEHKKVVQDVRSNKGVVQVVHASKRGTKQMLFDVDGPQAFTRTSLGILQPTSLTSILVYCPHVDGPQALNPQPSTLNPVP